MSFDLKYYYESFNLINLSLLFNNSIVFSFNQEKFDSDRLRSSIKSNHSSIFNINYLKSFFSNPNAHDFYTYVIQNYLTLSIRQEQTPITNFKNEYIPDDNDVIFNNYNEQLINFKNTFILIIDTLIAKYKHILIHKTSNKYKETNLFLSELLSDISLHSHHDYIDVCYSNLENLLFNKKNVKIPDMNTCFYCISSKISNNFDCLLDPNSNFFDFYKYNYKRHYFNSYSKLKYNNIFIFNINKIFKELYYLNDNSILSYFDNLINLFYSFVTFVFKPKSYFQNNKFIHNEENLQENSLEIIVTISLNDNTLSIPDFRRSDLKFFHSYDSAYKFYFDLTNAALDKLYKNEFIKI